MSKPGAIFSIGMGQRRGSKNREPLSFDSPAPIIEIVSMLDAVLVDVRALGGPAKQEDVEVRGNRKFYAATGSPIYDCRHGFWRYEWAQALGDRYRYLGDLLGGPGGGMKGPKPAGMDMLEAWHRAGQRLVLMCACWAVDDGWPNGRLCHRHHQIATRGSYFDPSLPAPLLDRGIDVAHVIDLRHDLARPKKRRVLGYVMASDLQRAISEGEGAEYDIPNLDDLLKE